MAAILVTHHEHGERRLFDPESGELTPAPPPPGEPKDHVERIYPKDGRGRFQLLGGTMFVLYRIDVRVRFRAGEKEVELGPGVTLEIESFAGENEVVATRDGAVVIRARYPSQIHRMVGSFIDPWEQEDDLDLVLFAAKVSDSPGRRQRIFATEDEIRFGEITQEDLRNAVRATTAVMFPRRRALDLRRELERWFWEWKPDAHIEGWGPNCALCANSAVSRTVIGVQFEVDGVALRAPFFRAGGPSRGTPMGFCDTCLRIAARFLSAKPGELPRADAANADLARALRGRGEVRDEEIAQQLATMSAGLPADPVLPAGASPCSICRKSGERAVAGRDARICASCVGGMRDEWRSARDHWLRQSSRGPMPSRWEDSGAYLFLMKDAFQLKIPLDVHPDLPIVIDLSELSFWEMPYDDVRIEGAALAELRRTIEELVQERFRRPVELRDE